MIDAVKSLRKLYRKKETDLLINRGEPEEVFQEVISKYNITHVIWNKDYSKLSKNRDYSIK